MDRTKIEFCAARNLCISMPYIHFVVFLFVVLKEEHTVRHKSHNRLIGKADRTLGTG